METNQPDIQASSFAEASSHWLQWFDWERYSNRQQTKMALGGFVGEIEYAGPAIKAFLPLIGAGELFRVGAGTSFGLGRYSVRGIIE